MFSTMEEDKNGIGHNGKSYKSNQSDEQTDIQKSDVTSAHLEQTLEAIEKNLNRKIEKLYEHEITESGPTKKILEINELRAELAELRSDIRSLKQHITEEADKNDHASNSK